MICAKVSIFPHIYKLRCLFLRFHLVVCPFIRNFVTRKRKIVEPFNNKQENEDEAYPIHDARHLLGDDRRDCRREQYHPTSVLPRWLSRQPARCQPVGARPAHRRCHQETRWHPLWRQKHFLSRPTLSRLGTTQKRALTRLRSLHRLQKYAPESVGTVAGVAETCLRFSLELKQGVQ